MFARCSCVNRHANRRVQVGQSHLTVKYNKLSLIGRLNISSNLDSSRMPFEYVRDSGFVCGTSARFGVHHLADNGTRCAPAPFRHCGLCLFILYKHGIVKGRLLGPCPADKDILRERRSNTVIVVATSALLLRVGASRSCAFNEQRQLVYSDHNTSL
ncbi:hypothetical protein J6590_071402 [Homalodisca vitripennis]|nr:hypothetical protein J6590_071402 [Homalodisca vitripennis]